MVWTWRLFYSQPLVYCQLTWQSLPVPVTALKQRLCWRNLRVFLVKYTTHLSKTSSSCFWMLSEIIPAVNLWIKISQLTSKRLQKKRLLYREHRQLHNGNRVGIILWEESVQRTTFWYRNGVYTCWPFSIDLFGHSVLFDRLKISSNGLWNVTFL